VLLEAGFAKVTPNEPKDISSWAYDYAASRVDIIDNRAKAVACYDAGYTLVEKLQTISTKYRTRKDGEAPVEVMRHYYDVHSLLQQPTVQAFVGTAAYTQHKEEHFPKADNRNIRINNAFHLANPSTRALYEKAYQSVGTLYYQGRPTFAEIMKTIGDWSDRL
jgi:hypothetical protein